MRGCSLIPALRSQQGPGTEDREQQNEVLILKTGLRLLHAD
jgi:hypothetical protein